MLNHRKTTKAELRKLVHTHAIQFAGNKKLKIYGMLSCKSCKRMKKQHRVFFSSERDAEANGYRPCGHCLRKKYLQWIEQESG